MPVAVCILDAAPHAGRERDVLLERLGSRMGVPARHLPLRLDLEGAYEPSRSQYDATALLRQVAELPREPGEKRLAVVDVDLFVPVLTYVFGQAQVGGHAAILSTCRLGDEFYGLPPDPRRLAERVEKEVLHELGHLFGLYHCRQFECVMRSSTDVEEVDLKRAAYCGACSAALGEALGRGRQ